MTGFEPRDVLGQVFDSAGRKQGPEILISVGWQDTDQWDVSLTPWNKGFAAFFGSQDGFIGDLDNVYGEVFGAAGGLPMTSIDMREGVAAVNNQQVYNQRDPSGIRLSGGDAAVFYTTDEFGGSKLQLKTVNQTGVDQNNRPVYAFTTVAVDSASTAVASPEAVARDSNAWAVVYENAGQIRLARGASPAVFDIVDVAKTSRAETDAQIALLKNGAYVVSWTDAGGDGAGNAGIKARIYSASDTAGAVFSVNDITVGAQDSSDIVALKDGGFLIVWRDDAADTIRGQQFSAAGAKLGASAVLASGGVDDPSIATLADGRVVLSYTKTMAGNADVMAVILDPRMTVEAATQGGDILTALVTGGSLSGLGGADTLTGSNRADTLSGGMGDDVLLGRGGADRIEGGAGRDDMSGGGGADSFVFAMVAHGSTLVGRYDVIRDFAAGSDKIDLSGIDAIRSTAANDAFSFVPAAGTSFSGRAGELRWSLDDKAGTADDRTYVGGDIDGDGNPDFVIELVGLVRLSASDFIL